MAIDLYAVCWNEMRMLPYFIRHYQPWVDRFFIYDDGSTDGSVEYLRSFQNVEVRPLPHPYEDSLVDSHRHLYDHCWRQSRGFADWVVITNIDEHLYHADITGYLSECQKKGITLIPAVGYQMFSAEFPHTEEKLCDVVQQGVPYRMMNKLSLFNPTAIQHTNFAVGRHSAMPEGLIVYPELDELRLLHYKFLGYEYLSGRWNELSTGLRTRDIANHWGYHYLSDKEASLNEYMTLKSSAERVIYPGVPPEKRNVHKRWWRPNPLKKRRKITRGIRKWLEKARKTPPV